MFLLSCISIAYAQSNASIWKCGNAYTNQPISNESCVLMPQSNVTVIEGTKLANQTPSASSLTSVKIDPQQQRERDAQARKILNEEMTRIDQRLLELKKQWNHGEVAKLVNETAQSAAYLQRVEKLKIEMQRTQADLAGVQREIARLP